MQLARRPAVRLPPLVAPRPASTEAARRCDAPALSGASLDSAGGVPLQWKQADRQASVADTTGAEAAALETPAAVPPSPVRYNAPLVLFIGALGIALSLGASRLKPPPLTLADLATSPYLPTRALLALRATFALVIGSSLWSSLTDPEPVRFRLITYAGTQLPPRAARFRGLERLTTYTLQCWALQLLYFGTAAAASALHLAGVRP